MILTVDSSALALLINPDANPPHDPGTGQPVTNAAGRVRHFLKGLAPNDTIIVPTPVLAEILVVADLGGPQTLAEISKSARIRTKAFGDRAAIETAALTQEAVLRGDKRSGSAAPYQKIKVDRQIIAIARIEQSTRLYADDLNLIKFAKHLGMDVFSTWDLPEPPEEPRDLFSLAS